MNNHYEASATPENTFGVKIWEVASHLYAKGQEDEYALPFNINGELDLNVDSSAFPGITGVILAVVHIGTLSEYRYTYSENAKIDVEAIIENSCSDEFASVEIGKIRKYDDKNARASYNYTIPKNLRRKLDRKIKDPDYEISLDVYAIVHFTENLTAYQDKVRIVGRHQVKYQMFKRTPANFLIS